MLFLSLQDGNVINNMDLYIYVTCSATGPVCELGVFVCELRFISLILRTEPQVPKWDLILRTDAISMETEINMLNQIW